MDIAARRFNRPVLFLVSLLFFLSGATALSAEVVLNKLLTYVFGSSHLATSTVLAAYMAGLSVGAWVFGRLARSSSRPLRAYAWLEFFIGIYYAVLPLLFGSFQHISILLLSPFAASPVLLTLFRFGLCFALVFVPTLMMGGTLPTLVSVFPREVSLQQSLPLLYAVNTLGAALGTLFSSYIVIPRFGLDGALYGCAGINLVICGVSLALPLRWLTSLEAERVDRASKPSLPLPFALPARAALLFAFAQGALAFVFEVVWFHLIGTVIGVTTYAFALMLFTILLGIGLGSLLLRRLLRGGRRAPLSVFVWSMVLLSISVSIAHYGWDGFPALIERTESLRSGGHFWAREAIRLGFCLAMLLPTTLAFGLSLPALAASVSVDEEGHSDWVGRLFASNTVGTIAGSLGTGFFLLGYLGSERILRFGALAALLLALVAFFLGQRATLFAPSRAYQGALGLFAITALTLFLFPAQWDKLRLTLGSHYYWATEIVGESRVAWLREDAQSGFITVVEDPGGKRTLRTNGKYEGSDEQGEFQDLFALLGGLYIHEYERVVLVGLGPARTLSVLHAMPFRHIEAVEFSPAIIAAAKEEFSEFSSAPIADKERVALFCDDGRNHIQLSKNQYDYVAIAISGAAFAGVGNIYSRDFFRAVAGKLNPDGVFMLWVQVHHVFPSDVRSVMATLRDVFPHVHFYTDPLQTQGFLLASLSPLVIDPNQVRALDTSPRVLSVLTQHGLTSTLDLVERSIFTTDKEIFDYLENPAIGAAPVTLTDLRPAFEYSTPYSLAEDLRGYDFGKYSTKSLPTFSPALDAEERALLEARRCFAGRDKRCALDAYVRARVAGQTDLYDALITTLEHEIGDAR